MSKHTPKTIDKKNPNGLSEQITFRHSESVKIKLMELSEEQNMGIADISRQIFNEGLKARYNVIIRGNQVVE
ncbi:hypothetical protein [Marinomonas sp.]|jgi:hypothetical protein|uniref:hypothetical protein n=1 Tax=Marinomonas sp. TaxID=1904862 RepID=UPI003BAB93CE|tara:strand:+ start:1223 stop:1438 length:216 start_codon:yes stop_codon:yes gene_type:complete